jgi:hypothetical protein
MTVRLYPVPRTTIDSLIASAISSLATVAHSGDYADLSGLPTLGTAAGKDASAFATAQQFADIAAFLAGLPEFGNLAELDTLTIGLIAATGTPSGTTYLRGDGTWATPPAGEGGSLIGARSVAGDSVLDDTDDMVFVAVTSAGYVRLPEEPRVGWLVRIVNATDTTISIQNSLGSELDLLIADGEWVEAQHLGGGDWRVYSWGPLMRQVARLSPPAGTSLLIYDAEVGQLAWQATQPTTTEIHSVALSNGQIVVTFTSDVSSVSLSDFAIAATLDDEPIVLSGLTYDHATRTLAFEPIERAELPQTLAVTVSSASESAVLVGGSDSDEIVIPSASTEWFAGETSLNDDLMHAWKMEANASDTVGTAHGTLSSPAPTFSTAKSGNGIVCAGSHFAQIGHGSVPTLGNGTVDQPFSLSMWVRPNNTNAEVLMSQATGATTGVWDLTKSFSAGQFTFRFRTMDNSAAARIVGDSAQLAANTTYHLVCTYDGSGQASGMKIYVNGAVSGSAAKESGYVAMEPLEIDMMIGARNPSAPALFFHGWMDEIYYWNRALTAAEAAELYASGAGVFVEAP